MEKKKFFCFFKEACHFTLHSQKGNWQRERNYIFLSFSSLREMLYFLIWTIAINNMIVFIKRYKQNLAVKSVKTASDSFLQELSCILNSKRLQPPKVTCLEPLLLEFRPLVATLMGSDLDYSSYRHLFAPCTYFPFTDNLKSCVNPALLCSDDGSNWEMSEFM